MKSVSRRRFGQLALLAPFALLSGQAAHASLIETILSRAPTPRHDSEVWVLVDDRESSLSVYRGNALVERFAPVSLGRSGANTMRTYGGNVTPKGEFRVNRFNWESQWHIFIGIDYPTPSHARTALETGLYTEQDYADYFAYYRRHGYPPQQTVLGGFIGIHGLGRADPEVHASYHWTQGCVAVTDAQIERLSELIDIGTRVVIR
ncbi:L,D-transpeptidase family protein [Billgrantia ethanolica]|uniref:L,D-transpeptidase n=1 Tax=Billgrantia ethanolica TaxID=2733486 RepID=A0ABS9A3S8_9GAMM|nr:L,D-transpeptidase [Halomonas ethanolica]MCE8002469.1 L,D-transpeptidase [Halomonas ethanolica]